MKTFFRGLAKAFLGLLMIAMLAVSILALAQVFTLDGYTAVATFIWAAVLLFADCSLIYQFGRKWPNA